MEFGLADNYYLKALDYYPHDLEKVSENLNYALSYDPEHDGANALMAKLYAEVLEDYETARAYFDAAMASNPKSIKTCRDFFWALIRSNKFEEASNLCDYLETLEDFSDPELYRMKALVAELLGDFEKAKSWIMDSMNASYDNNFVSFLENELKRVEKKMKRAAKAKAETKPPKKAEKKSKSSKFFGLF